MTRSKGLVLGAALGLIAAQGCGNGEGVAAGGQCFLVTDCATGLVCIPKGSIRVCSNNVTTIETEVDAGMDVAVVPDGPAPPPPGGGTGTDSAPPPADTGTPDVATPKDTGAPEVVAPKDTGTPDVAAPQDTGTPG